MAKGEQANALSNEPFGDVIVISWHRKQCEESKDAFKTDERGVELALTQLQSRLDTGIEAKGTIRVHVLTLYELS